MRKLYLAVHRILTRETCWPRKHRWVFITRRYGVWWECSECFESKDFEPR